MADDRYVREVLKEMQITDADIEREIENVMKRPCGILCLTRTTFEDGIRRATDPSVKKQLRTAALELIMENVFGPNYEKILVAWLLPDMEMYILEKMEDYLNK